MTKAPHATRSLHDESFEKDACGIGLVARIDGRAERDVVTRSLEVLARLAHRGAVGADGRTSDGAGILTQIPKGFFRAQPVLGMALRQEDFAVGVFFMPQDGRRRGEQEKAFARLAEEMGFTVRAWRTAPAASEYLGAMARALEPVVRQVFLVTTRSPKTRDQALLQLRRRAESEIGGDERATRFHICSLSFHTMVYKGLLLPGDVGRYYRDLAHPDFRAAFAVVHSRFSTNTLPAWALAHPFRNLCHNGEINTIRGNLNWMRARGGHIPAGLSDSASLDRAVDLLLESGRSLPEALMMLIPEAWETDRELTPEVRAFYEYHAPRMEPWDGPAAVCFADHRYVGATLDRSGLRPCRYEILGDGTFLLASEAGVLAGEHGPVVARGRLGPGEMIALDLQAGKILRNDGLKRGVAIAHPYADWVRRERTQVARGPEEILGDLDARLDLFGYTDEEIERMLLPMMELGEEPTSSMGNDTPLAVLSRRPQPLFRYFRQQFAQVTNPPIDPIRERTLMSLTTYLGGRPSPFTREAARRKYLRLEQPILEPGDFSGLAGAFPAATVDLSFAAPADDAGFARALEEALENAVAGALRHARAGIALIILSDRGADAARAGVPVLLATGAVHHALLAAGLRPEVSLVIDTGDARDVHQFACLLGYGADAIHPYLVFELIRQRAETLGLVDPARARQNYVEAAGRGLLTVIAKMGITVLQSYGGAQVFEIVGLGRALVDRCFAGTPSRLGGLGLRELARETRLRHARVHERGPDRYRGLGLPSAGEVHFRADGETHFWNPGTIAHLQTAARTGDAASFARFSAEADRAHAATLRGLLAPRPKGQPVPLASVESAATIVKRFTTGAMSFGSLSPEAHESLALAMNRIGAKSNSGEGGESGDRFRPAADGSSRNSAIKQVASGRFGVTIEYLTHARELQIKIAQGAKPGEGGKLPGHKVNAEIARLRHSTPGVTLISPPPHHDIYSIEDLAQLIHDLKQANDAAVISVKLVATAGVGTIAAGVAKAGAGKILISGDSGGTGASPLSSIKHAGAPWELGLAEAHEVLVTQGLRGRVVLETDGQLKTARDVAIAAMLGAEEFGFSTAPLIAEGCVMMRKCHLNTCPVGIATQDPALRAKFTGQPEHVINYFFFVAEELRRIMAELGFRTVAELVGRRDCLQAALPPRTENADGGDDDWKARTLDLAPLLVMPTSAHASLPTLRSCVGLPTAPPLGALESALFALAKPGLEHRQAVRGSFVIQNSDRAAGTRLASAVARRFGAEGLPHDTILADLHGVAGQSFGAFLAPGITLKLHGVANDYVGKGLSGGRVIVAPPWLDEPERMIVAGNACLYGATSGEAHFAGCVGERFAVRNSGALATVEGTGDHACEYMTGGRVLILGEVGRNFAAGMSGGVAYVLDDRDQLRTRLAPGALEVLPLAREEDLELVHGLLKVHLHETGSPKARRLLRDWGVYAPRFLVVTPIEYLRALRAPAVAVAEAARVHG